MAMADANVLDPRQLPALKSILVVGFVTPGEVVLDGSSLVRFLDHVRSRATQERVWYHMLNRSFVQVLPEMISHRVFNFLGMPACEIDSATFGSQAARERTVWGRIYRPSWLVSYRYINAGGSNLSETDGTESSISTPRTAPDQQPTLGLAEESWY